MIVGNRSRFAIEAEPTSVRDDWISGHFRFWIAGKEVGDWDDSADLWGSWHWLRDFQKNRPDRFDASLVGLAPDDIFRLLYDAAMGSGAIADPAEQVIPYTITRFHLGYLGMSSFEQFDLLLVKDEVERERFLWRRADSAVIHEFTFEPNEMEAVAGQFCDQFEKLYISN
jgi:Immunity protein 42